MFSKPAPPAAPPGSRAPSSSGLLLWLNVDVSLPGGLRQHAAFVARGLAARGHRGSIFSTKGHPPPRDLFPPDWPVLVRKASPVSLPGLFPSLASRPSLHRLAQFFMSKGWPFPASSLPPDAILFYGTGWDYSGFAALRLARRHGLPFLVWPAVHAGTWGDDRIDLRLYAQAGAVLVQSQFEAAHLQSLGLAVQKIVRSAPPPFCSRDGKASRFRANYNLPPSDPLVLFLGRRETAKGYPCLLQAWPRLLARHPAARLVLAGPGEKSPSLPPRTLDLGLIDEDTKADALAASTLLCLPSSTESYGMVFTEAWVYGHPVVGGPAAPSRELIESAQGGLLVAQDPADLADKINHLLDNPTLAQQLGRNGQTYTRTHLDPTDLLDQLECLLYPPNPQSAPA